MERVTGWHSDQLLSVASKQIKNGGPYCGTTFDVIMAAAKEMVVRVSGTDPFHVQLEKNAFTYEHFGRGLGPMRTMTRQEMEEGCRSARSQYPELSGAVLQILSSADGEAEPSRRGELHTYLKATGFTRA